jgi:glycosyltransferase involved in cell wall biosynthesis
LTAPQKPLRILISGKEICGLVSDLSRELKRRGHTVRTASTQHPFFPARYDYSQTRFPQTYLGREFGGTRLWHSAFDFLRRASPSQHARVERQLRIRAVRNADVYLRVWAHQPFEEEVLIAAKQAGVKVATFLMGSDVRDYDAFSRQYGVTGWSFPEECFDPPFADKLHALRLHERYADALFSVPDQMSLALRPYHHLQIPIRLERFSFNIPGRSVPRVIHAPSAPHVKGTDLIERAIATLQSEGIPIEFVTLRNVPNSEVPGILSEADVLVDELILHGPGWLSFEAMASGCAVATRYLEDSPPGFRPPVWRIDESNITDRLRILLTDRDLRTRLGREGRDYVERNNTIAHVVDQVLMKVNATASDSADYYPDFLVKSYEPANVKELEAINTANRIVAREDWYTERIAGHSRSGLIF